MACCWTSIIFYQDAFSDKIRGYQTVLESAMEYVGDRILINFIMILTCLLKNKQFCVLLPSATKCDVHTFDLDQKDLFTTGSYFRCHVTTTEVY